MVEILPATVKTASQNNPACLDPGSKEPGLGQVYRLTLLKIQAGPFPKERLK
jgi:hypothetical protein